MEIKTNKIAMFLEKRNFEPTNYTHYTVYMTTCTCTCLNVYNCYSCVCVQIYVEVPRARLTMELTKMKEAEGLVSEAADILQELQVHVHVHDYIHVHVHDYIHVHVHDYMYNVYSTTLGGGQFLISTLINFH